MPISQSHTTASHSLPKPSILYVSSLTPNTERVRIVLAEKKIDIPMKKIRLHALEHLQETYKKINPYQQTPALVLEDGNVITESVAICEYVEQLQHTPCLFKHGLDQIKVSMWIRRVDLLYGSAVRAGFHHQRQVLPGVYFKDYGQHAEKTAQHILLDFEKHLKHCNYLAGDFFSMADICLISMVYFAHATDTAPVTAKTHPHILAWIERLKARAPWFAFPYKHAYPL